MKFLYALPAILGFTGFVVYLLLRNRRPPSPVLMGILALIRDRAGQLPTLDKRLSGKAVYALLSDNEELRKAITPEEMELLNGIRTDEESENRRVFSFLTLAIALSLVLFVVLEWRPWDNKSTEIPRPISELIYNVRVRSPVTSDYQAGFDLLKNQFDALLAEAQKQPNPTKHLSDQGLFFRCQPGADPSRLENYKVTLLPGGVFAANLVKTENPAIPEVFRSFLLSIVVVENTDASIRAALTDPKAPSLWRDLLMASIGSPYMPLSVTLDFQTNTLAFALHNVKPAGTRVTHSVKYWNDFKNHAIVILPAMLSTSDLELFEIWSSVGPEQPSTSQIFHKRTRIVEGESQDYFVYR